jgi:hypothetical protein
MTAQQPNRKSRAQNRELTSARDTVRMEDTDNPGPDESALVRYGFAAIFIAACLYDLTLGMRVAGVFLVAIALYEAVIGRVPLQWNWQTTGYLRGTAAMVVVASTIFIGVFLIFAPEIVLHLLARSQGLPDLHK